MQFNPTILEGCYEITPNVLPDNRGKFIKTYHCDLFAKHGLNTNWHEEYFSSSHKNVIRGMHFQLPPYAHAKLVYCVSGMVLDVVVDLRKSSKTYKKHICLELTDSKCNMLSVPKGCAHGFKSLQDNTIMMYKVATVYNPEADYGIAWDSCRIDWQLGDTEAIISKRDSEFIKLEEFNSPF